MPTFYDNSLLYRRITTFISQCRNADELYTLRDIITSGLCPPEYVPRPPLSEVIQDILHLMTPATEEEIVQAALENDIRIDSHLTEQPLLKRDAMIPLCQSISNRLHEIHSTKKVSLSHDAIYNNWHGICLAMTDRWALARNGRERRAHYDSLRRKELLALPTFPTAEMPNPREAALNLVFDGMTPPGVSWREILTQSTPYQKIFESFVQSTELSEGVMALINDMENKQYPHQLFIRFICYKMVSAHNHPQTPINDVHSVGMRIELLDGGTAIKILFYDPNEPRGHKHLRLTRGTPNRLHAIHNLLTRYGTESALQDFQQYCVFYLTGYDLHAPPVSQYPCQSSFYKPHLWRPLTIIVLLYYFMTLHWIQNISELLQILTFQFGKVFVSNILNRPFLNATTTLLTFSKSHHELCCFSVFRHYGTQ